MPLSFWRDLALIWLVLWGILAAIAPLVALFFANRGLYWLRGKAGIYLPLANYYVRKGRDITVKSCTRVSGPLIEAQARLTEAGAVLGKPWHNQ